jgi:serine/threonine-protein kinase
VDRRADIWAFGVILFEMLTARQLFPGRTVSDTLAGVLKGDIELTGVPAEIRPVVERCLRRDQLLRWRSIGDVLLLLDQGLCTASPVAARRSVLPWAIAGALALALAVIGVGFWNATRPADHPLIRFNVDLGPEAMPGLNLTAAISPDGRRLVFPARGPDGRRQLATRLLDQAQITLLPGTENGSDPFFSPDSQWIAFFAGPILKKISVLGGAPETVVTGQTDQPGGSWGRDGNIVTCLSTVDALFAVSSGGGVPRRITRLGAGVLTNRWPQVLPGGGAVLYTASSSVNQMDGASIEIVPFKTGRPKVLARGYYGRYLPTGHLVYIRQGVLFGVKFDPEALEVRGAPVPLLEDVAANSVTGGGQFDFSNTGTFVYTSGKSAAPEWQLSWLDRSGTIEPLMPTPGLFALPRISPDGRKVAFIGKGGDVYVYDLERRTLTQLTFTGGVARPLWSPDSLHLLFLSASGLTWMRGDGAGEPQTILKGALWRPYSLTPDGRWLAYFERSPETGMDIWTVALDLTDPENPKAGKPEAFLRTEYDETVPQFSPDGRWISYRSNENETGSLEIYVRPFPAAGGGKWQISTGGGLYAVWSKNGRELFYETTDNRIMVVDYSADGGSFLYSQPRLWSDKQLFYTGTINLDLAPDGKRFLVFSLPEATPGAKGSVHVTVLENFFDWVRKKLP